MVSQTPRQLRGSNGVTFSDDERMTTWGFHIFWGVTKSPARLFFPKMHTQRWTAGSWKWWFGSDDFPLFSGYNFTLGLFLLGRNGFSRNLLPPKTLSDEQQQGPYLKCIARIAWFGWWQLKYFFIFTSKIGKMIQFDLRIFFKWVASTTT